MPSFEVTLRRTIEWNDTYDAPTQLVAEDLARLEAIHGTIVDEQIITQQVD